MHENILKDCGLTQNESKVYLTLLKIGKSTSGNIVKESKISSGKIYETLNKLVEKGLVKTFTENGVKKFLANNPNTLINYLKDKEKEIHEKEKTLKKILPEIHSLHFKDDSLETVFLIKGFRGIKELVYDTLESGKEIKIMGINSKKDETYNNFWRNWHKERILRKKKALIISSDTNNDYWKFFKKLPYTEMKSLSTFTPSAIMIIDNHVFIFSYEEDFTCVHILSESISNSFKGFFNDLWKVAKK